MCMPMNPDSGGFSLFCSFKAGSLTDLELTYSAFGQVNPRGSCLCILGLREANLFAFELQILGVEFSSACKCLCQLVSLSSPKTHS